MAKTRPWVPKNRLARAVLLIAAIPLAMGLGVLDGVSTALSSWRIEWRELMRKAGQ